MTILYEKRKKIKNKILFKIRKEFYLKFHSI